MSRIYWDSMLFIYWLENNPRYAERVQQIRDSMKMRQDQLCTSAFTVGETLVGFHMRQDLATAARVRAFFLESFIEIVPYTVDIADSYAEIRARLKVSPADAIHLACAAKAGTDLFLTNDKALIGQVVPGIQFIAGLDTNII
jgi:uncharacterized protein